MNFFLFLFAIVIGEVDSKKFRLTLGANKIREFTKNYVADMRKLLLDHLSTNVDNLFLDSLDDIQVMSPSSDTSDPTARKIKKVSKESAVAKS